MIREAHLAGSEWTVGQLASVVEALMRTKSFTHMSESARHGIEEALTLLREMGVKDE